MSVAPLLRIQLVLHRVEWPTLAALVVCVAAAALQWVVLPTLEQRGRAVGASHTEGQVQESRQDEESVQARRYRAFRDRLADDKQRSEWLKVIFAQGAAAGITLSQGDYTLIPDADGGYDKLQIVLPVKASYAQIRAFANALLEKLPALSLDEVSLRRDSIKSANVEARLRLTLYLKDAR